MSELNGATTPTRGAATTMSLFATTVRRLALVVGVGVIASLLLSYFFSGNLELRRLLEVRPAFLVLALALVLYPWAAHAVEMKIWARFFGRRLAFGRAMSIAVATDVGAAVTPTLVGGGPVKGAMLARAGFRPGEAAVMVVLCGLEDLAFFVVLLGAGVALSDRIGIEAIVRALAGAAHGYWVLALVTLAMIVAVGLVLRYGRHEVIRRVRSFLGIALEDALGAVRTISRRGAPYFLLAAAAIMTRWVSRFLVLVVLLMGLRIEAPYLEVFLSEWMVYVGMTVTPTPGAAGGAEAMFYLVFRDLVPAAHLGVVMAAWRFLNGYFLLVIAGLALPWIIRSSLSSESERDPSTRRAHAAGLRAGALR